MHHNRTDSSHSTFKMPMLPQPPPSQSETLLFNDIMEEKTLALRNTLNEFLRVQPYRRFNAEFNDFLKRAQRIIHEGQRSGANISRVTNSSQIAPLCSRPSASFNYRPLTPMSMTSSNTSNRTSTFRIPQNSFRPIEPVNPFKPPENMNYEPRVVLPRIEHSSYNSRVSSNYATVIEVNQVENESARTEYVKADVHVNYQPPESEVHPQSVVAHNSYSDVTINENINDKSASCSQEDPEHNENDDEGNAIESLLEEVGFKILVGLPDQSDKSQDTKKSNASQLKNQENVKENIEKYLSKWSVNIKIIKSQLKSSKVIVLLTGTLLEKDQVTVIEKQHEAGVLESRKEKNLVKTNKGIYRLIGNIIGGHPNEFYQTCLALKGIPRNWRNFMKTFFGAEKTTKNALLNFSLDSPAGPRSIKSKKNTLLDMSMTRRGTTYGKHINVNQKISGKRKIPEYDVPENSKNKQRKLHEPLSPLLASTPKRPRKQATMFETPSEILKNKIHQNLCNKTRAKSDSRSLNNVNDSIHLTKKKQSISREQTSIFLKPKEPLKTSLSSNNSTKHSRQSAENSSSIRSINKSINKNLSKQTSIKKNNSKQISISQNQSKSTSKNNSNTLNCSLSKQSKVKTTEISNSSEQRCQFISSLNSTENSMKKCKKTSKIDKSTKITTNKKKSTKLIKNNESSSRTRSNIDDSKDVKVIKKKTKNCSNNLKNTNVPISKPIKPMKQCSSSAVIDLFGNMNGTTNDDDVNDYIMSSPTKLSVKSHTDKSRSETPPLFSHQWSSTAKSLVLSEPPTPLSKSVEAKILKRVKAPKLTLEEEIKNNKVKNNKQVVDYNTVTKKINKMLEFGEQYDNDD